MHVSLNLHAQTAPLAIHSPDLAVDELRIFVPDDDDDRIHELANLKGGMQKSPGYLPTPLQIAEECRAIQSGWCEDERFWRANGNLYRAERASQKYARKLAAAKGG
ncbi:hypothetical protein [Schlesneria paludicola]|uniref:hypothetical protein n=1 Tax=Schlesneria paludicola TaxID=360056 RepID=UPI00029A9867|nr:hypothetical protein [Schlesneria paludicola]